MSHATIENPLLPLGEKAKAAGRIFASLRSSEKDNALLAIADALEQQQESILVANRKDMKAAEENGLSSAMQDRLLLNSQRIADIAEAVRYVATLPDPVGKTLSGERRPNGLEIQKKTVPLGVIGLIYESRPNVTVDCAVLCLKAGNACILRGGSEAIHSNIALSDIIRQSLEQSGLPKDAVQLIQDTERSSSTYLMQLTGYVDVLIPRGGQGLIQSVVKNATVPVIETGAGVCHIYLDDTAEADMAIAIVENAKTSRPSVCNAVETLLVHQDRAKELLPLVENALAPYKVELRGCKETLAILPSITPATQQDWSAEYGDYILAIRVVPSVKEAITHIQTYSTGHSDAIITTTYDHATLFTKEVDSAAVFVNASTRFTDGGEFGLGAEIGISTQKLHVRGPMGLEALTSTKYVVLGEGQIRK